MCTLTTINMIFNVTSLSLFCSTLIVNRGIVTPTLPVIPTLIAIPCTQNLEEYRFTALPLLSLTKWFSHPNFNHPWHYFITSCWQREGRVSANGWTHPSSTTVFIRSVIQNVPVVASKHHITLNITFSVAYFSSGPKWDTLGKMSSRCGNSTW